MRVTQRWGVGSTRLHLDVEALALGVMLFDRIVLPTPSDVAEADRWDALGWDTQAHANMIIRLGTLVHFAPWDERLRGDWRAEWERAREIGAESRDLAYSLTPRVIAQSAWTDVYRHAQEGQPVRPLPVMWADGARAIVPGAEQRPTAPYAEVTALRFRRELELPARSHPEETLDAALSLAGEADFQAARRRLYDAEAIAAGEEVPLAEFASDIDDAVRHYNEVVTAYERSRVRRVIHHVLPTVVGQAVAPVPGGKWGAEKVLARLLPLPPGPQPAQEEGAAIAMAERTMAAVAADRR
jgi:hypothetical protein